MYRECKKIESPKEYCIWVSNQQDHEVDDEIVGGEEWQEEVYNRVEWKKLLRMARNRHILHMAME
jgi:hypothetical protein